MASGFHSEEVAHRLRELWGSFMSCASFDNPQERSKYLECFMIEFLDAYHSVKGELKRISGFGDIHSISNVLTSEFQAAIFLRCQDETEQSMVDYLCHGQGLLHLQMLCILANKIAGCSLELANLLVSLLPVVLRVSLKDYDAVYGLEVVLADFEDYYRDSKGTSFHANLAKEMTLDLCFKDHYQRFMPKGSEAGDLPLNIADVKTESDHADLPCLPKCRSESSSTTEDSDKRTSLTSVTDIDTTSTNVSECSDSDIGRSVVTTPKFSHAIRQSIPRNVPVQEHTDDDREHTAARSSLAIHKGGHSCINNFQLSLLLVSTLENLTCHSNSSLHDPDLLMHTSGQLIEILHTLSTAKERHVIEENADVLCNWEPASLVAVQLVITRTVFAILYTACRNSKAAKQLSKSLYVEKLVKVASAGCLDKEFLSTHQHSELAKLFVKVSDRGKMLESKLSSSYLWRTFQSELLLGCSLQGLVLFVTTCLHHGTVINSSLSVLCLEIFEQFSSKGAFESLAILLLKLDEVHPPELSSEDKSDEVERQIASPARRIEQFPKNLSKKIVRSFGKMISMLKKGKRCCKSNRELSSRKNSVIRPRCPVVHEDDFPMCKGYPQSSEVEESSESAADMEFESERQDQFLDDVCAVSRPSVTLLTVFKESKNTQFRMNLLNCLEKVGICQCVSPEILVTSLLSRFVDQPKDLQAVILRVINQLVLTEIDIVEDSFDVLSSHFPYSKKMQKSRFKATKQSPGKSDSGFSAGDFNVAPFGAQVRDLYKGEKPSWTCLSHYCMLLSAKDTATAVEVIKALKPLATLGSKYLKEELFRVVVLPCILRCDGVFTDDVAEPLQKIRARSWTGSFSSDWQQQRQSFRGRSLPSFSNGDSSRLISEKIHTDDGVCTEVLELCICYLTSLLTSSVSRELFLNCGGLNEMQCFLALPQLQQPVLHVLEFLANIENRDESRKAFLTDKADLSAGSPETSSEEKTDSRVCCQSFLSLLQYTTSFVEGKNAMNDSASGVPCMTSCHPVESSLRVYVWKSCLQLLTSNELFCELFLADNGVLYSYELLRHLFQWFEGHDVRVKCDEVQKEDGKFVTDLVGLFESVLPICIRMAHTEQWQSKETLPSLKQLVEEAKKILSQSDTLQCLLGNGLSNCFLKASMWQLDATLDSTQLNSEMKQQRNEVLRRASNGDSQEEWSQPLEDDDDDDDDDDNEGDGNLKGDNSILEEGYDADQEGDSDRNDETEQRTARNRRQPKERRRDGDSKDQPIIKGIVIYPQICNILLQLLKVCYGRRLQAADSDSLLIVHHAVESLLHLLKDCEENCQRLCQQGLVCTLLECFRDVLIIQDQAFKGLQSLVADVFVCLASHTIRANELWDFLTLFNGKTPPVQLLSAAASEVAAKAKVHSGPAYMMSFPCFAKGVERRASAVTSGKGASGKLKQIKGKRALKSKSPSLQQSNNGTSSEDESLPSGSSPSRLVLSESFDKSPKRVQRRPRSFIEGGKRRGSARRGTRKSAGSPSFTGNSGEYELIEVVEYEGWIQLPSPFLVWAVQLPFHGSLPRSERGFSLAMWVCLTFPGFGSESDTGAAHANGDSSGRFGSVIDRRNLSRQERIVHLCSVGSGKSLFEVWVIPPDGSLVVRWTKNHKGTVNPVVVLKERIVRLPAFTRGHWHHLVISVIQPKRSAEERRGMEGDGVPMSKLLVVVDGTEVTVQDFGPPLPWHEEAKFTLSTLLLGHVIGSSDSKCSNIRASFHGGYEIGNVFVFAEKSTKTSKHSKTAPSLSTDWLVDKEEAFYLYSLGPNSASLGQLSKDFNLVSQSPDDSSQPFLEAVSLWCRLAITEKAVAANLPPGFLTSPHVIVPDLELSLKQRLAAVYSPAFPLMFHQYAELLTSEDRQGRGVTGTEQRLKSREHEPVGATSKVTSGVQTHRRHTLLESAHHVGGISVFIYLFAKVVELTEDEKTQADALSVVLSLQYVSAFHARAMVEESGFPLLKRILLSPECKIGYHTLKVLMEAACDGDVFKPTNLTNDPIMLNIDSTAVVRNVAIFQHFLLNWKIWEKAKQGVLEMLLATIDILVHGSHSYNKFNIIQFQKAQLVQQILIGCQERQNEGCKEIPRVISSLYVNIIQNIMGNPPDLTVLKAVCEFLIAVHPTDDISRLHAPSRCYLREHSLDLVQFSNQSSPVKIGPISSPRTAPIRSIHSRNPFQFSSPVKGRSRVSLSRSLSYESLRKQDQGSRACDVQNILKHERLSKLSPTSSKGGGGLSRSVSGGLDAGSSSVFHWNAAFSGKASRGAEENNMPQFCDSVEEGNGIDPFTKEASVVTGTGERNLTVAIPNRKRSEELSSSELVLYESHFWDPDPKGTSSPTLSPVTPLGMSYPEMSSIPGSKPMVIRKYGSTPSREEQSSVDLMEYDLINESDFSSLRSSVPHPSSNDDYLVVEGFPGIQSSTVTYCPTRVDSYAHGADAMIKLRLGLMKLLEMKLFNLPPEHVPAVIGEVLKAEYMPVWAYHDSNDVREFAIRILFQYLQKAEPNRCEQFLQIRGFHLLANQIC